MPTTTPLVWEDTFGVASDTAGSQQDPVTVGLSNGNILVVWQDSNNTTASGQGSDIVGQIFDPLGAPLGTAFQLNAFGTARDESEPAITANDEGGFAIVYLHPDGDDTNVLFEVYDANGTRTDGGYVVNDTSGSPSYDNPQVVFRPADGSYLFVYEEETINGSVLMGRILSAGGSMGAAFTVRIDAGSATTDGDPINPKLAVLADGETTVAVYQELDGTDYDIEFQFISSDGTVSDLTEVTSNTVPDREPDVAALTGGGFVVVWDRGGDIYGQIFDENGNPVGSEITLAGNTDSKNEAQVIGLKDGGFFVVWDDDTDLALEGKRFDSNGNAVGSSIDIMDLDTTRPDVALTGDGRILVAGESLGDVFLNILDPRNKTIIVDDGSVTVAARTGSNITGSDANDVFYGMEGDDVLSGGKGKDTLSGGQGNDEIRGGKGNDDLGGGQGADEIIGGDGNDTGNGGKGNDRFEGGAGNDSFEGSAGKDTAFGNQGADTLNGGDDNDDLYGSGGQDALKGGKGKDVLIGGGGRDDLTGGNGQDVFVFLSRSDSKAGSTNRDVIRDFTHTVDRIDFSAIDADTTTGGNQAFTFIGAAGFSDAGQLRAQVTNGNIILQLDRDGDGSADMEIKLDGPVTVDTFDFIL